MAHVSSRSGAVLVAQTVICFLTLLRVYRYILLVWRRVFAGDDRAGESPAAGGVGEAEAARAGAPSVPGERVAAGRAGEHAAASAAQRAAVRRARRAEEASRVHGRDEQVRTPDHTGSLSGTDGPILCGHSKVK